MSDNKILSQILKNLKQIGVETGKEALKQAGEVTHDIISAKELLGLESMTDQELAQKKAEDERKRNEEIAKLQSSVKEPGRNVEVEMKQVSEEDKRKQQEEEQFLENLRRQREAEELERQQLMAGTGESANPAKRKKKRGSAMAQGKKKTSAPDPSQMSATAEFSGKME